MLGTRSLKHLAVLVSATLALALVVPAEARWPSGAKQMLALSPLGQNAELIHACPDGNGGAYLTWYDNSVPSRTPLRHIDAFGDDVFATSTWNPDTSIGISGHLANDGRDLLMLSGVRTGSTTVTLLLSRIGPTGNRQWTRSLWTGTSNGDLWYWTRITCDVGGAGTFVAWMEGRDPTTEYTLRVQRVGRDGTAAWGTNGATVAPLSLPAYTQAGITQIATDGEGGLWIAFKVVGDTLVGLVQHVHADGSLAYSMPGLAVESGYYPRQIQPDGAGGLYVALEPFTSPYAARLQRLRADGSLALGPHGISPQSPAVYSPAFGEADAGRVYVASQEQQAPGWWTHVQLMDSSGTWLWPSPVLTGKCTGQTADTRLFRNPDGSTTVTLHPSAQIPNALEGAQRISIDGSRLWPEPPPTLLSVWDQRQAYEAVTTPNVMLSTGDGGVLDFYSLADSGQGSLRSEYGIRAQHLDAYGRRGDTSPRIVSARDVPNDLGGWIEVRWAASCLEGDATMATSGYDVLRESPDGTWSAVAHVAASGASEYVTTVPTLADSTSPTSPRTVVRVRATDASARTWTSPGDSAASYANSPPLAVDAASSRALVLEPPSPSPANATALVRFALPDRSRVTLQLYDATGRRVRRLVDAEYPAGSASALLVLADDAGRTLAPGIYIVRLEAGGVSRSRRLVVIR